MRKLWSHLCQPSTRAFLREGRRTPNYSFLDLLHGYVYARWVYAYIAIGIGEHPLVRAVDALVVRFRRLFGRTAQQPDRDTITHPTSQTVARSYHGKVVLLEGAKKLVTVNKEVNLTNLEHVIPYPKARDIVLHNPDHIALLDCPCRLARAKPCLPLDVCLIIGEPFAGFVIEHYPQRARWITVDEALSVLEAEHDRGHVHHAFFKDAMFNRFYAICNCCSCCCGAMQAHRHGIPMLASSGFISQVDENGCIGCGLCAERCPFGALSMVDGLATVGAAQCFGCGVCADQCVNDAISLIRAPERGEPLDIQALAGQHDQCLV